MWAGGSAFCRTARLLPSVGSAIYAQLISGKAHFGSSTHDVKSKCWGFSNIQALARWATHCR